MCTWQFSVVPRGVGTQTRAPAILRTRVMQITDAYMRHQAPQYVNSRKLDSVFKTNDRQANFFTEYRSIYSIFYWIHRHPRSQLPWFRHNNMYWWIHVTHTPYSGGLFIWWWRHYTFFSALLAFCEGNPLIASGFPTQRPVAWSLDIYFDAQTFEIVELPMILRHHDSHVAEMTLKGK